MLDFEGVYTVCGGGGIHGEGCTFREEEVYIACIGGGICEVGIYFSCVGGYIVCGSDGTYKEGVHIRLGGVIHCMWRGWYSKKGIHCMRRGGTHEGRYTFCVEGVVLTKKGYNFLAEGVCIVSKKFWYGRKFGHMDQIFNSFWYG